MILKIAHILFFISFFSYQKDSSEELLIFNSIKENFSLENTFEAHRLSQQFIKKYPKSIKVAEVYYILGEVESNFFKSIFYFRNVIKNFPTSFWAVSSQMSLALKYYTIGDHSKSNKELELFILKYPDSINIDKAIFFRGLNFLNLKNNTKAKEFFSLIIDKHPNSKWALESKVNLGHIYLDEKKYKLAIDLYKETLPKIKSTSLNSLVLEKLGTAYIQSGEKNLGYEQFNKLITSFPKSDSAIKISRTYNLLEKKKTARDN